MDGRGVRGFAGTLLIAVVALAGAGPALGQCPRPISPGGTTSGNGRAPGPRYRGIRTVYLLTPSEMAAALPSGVSLTGIGWHYTTAPGFAASGSLSIYLQNTSDTTFSKSASFAAALSGMTLVHNDFVTAPNSTVPFDIPFANGSPFSYTGGGLYVAFEWSYPVGALSTTMIVSVNTVLTNGIETSQTTAGPPSSDTLVASNFRPETRLTAQIANDATITYIATYGLLPGGLAAPQVVGATVMNLGGSTISSLPITLTITGANPYTDTQMAGTMEACSGQTTVLFAPFPVASLGDQTLTVSVPADEVPLNSAKSMLQRVTRSQFSYMYPGMASEPSGIGTNIPAEFTNKFTTLAPTQVDSVTFDFPLGAPAARYRVSIRIDDGSGGPGAQVYVDPFERIPTAGSLTLRLPSPVLVPAGNFFVGTAQTTSVSLGLGFNYEVPLRFGSFFLTNASGGFNDLAALYTFKPNIGAIVGACLANMTVDVTPDSGQACIEGNIVFSANAGNSTGSLTYQWTENGIDIPGATSSTLTVTKNAASSFSYNCRVTDDAGCTSIIDPSSSTGSWATVPPPEADGLAFGLDKQTLSWNPALGASRYDLVRGDVLQLPVGPGGGDEQCFADIAGTSTIDGSLPPSGSGYWYDLRAENACGVGVYGFQSNGAPRITSTCP